VLILVVGFLAGTVNTVVGSGSLLTFPTLIALGYPPLIANVSNNIGLAPGSVSGAVGYRRELAGQRSLAIRLGVVAAAGGAIGAALLLLLPASAFERIVPVLILIACGLVIAQSRLSAIARERSSGPHERRGLDPLLPLGVGGTGVYGGYFGAAQGVILMALLGMLVDRGDRDRRAPGGPALHRSLAGQSGRVPVSARTRAARHASRNEL
jgi:hypothetical protein